MMPQVRLTDGLSLRDSYDVDNGKLLNSVTLGTGHEV